MLKYIRKFEKILDTHRDQNTCPDDCWCTDLEKLIDKMREAYLSDLKTLNYGVEKKNINKQAKLIEYMTHLYETKTGLKFKADKKHYIIVANLLKNFTMLEVLEKIKILAIYCENNLDWWSKSWSDFTVENLSARWNSLIPKLTEEQKLEKELREHNEYLQSIGCK